MLLEMPNITVKRCTVLNPATLLPTPDEGEQHDCVAAITQVCSPRPDLQETPLQNPDVEFFVDGSASRNTDTGKNQTGYVTTNETVKSGPLPSHFSAQAAELMALTEACKLADGKTVTIYTDSRYTHGVVNDFGTLWKNRNFLTATGKPVAHHQLVSELLNAIQLPKTIEVYKCDAHTNGKDPKIL